MRQRPHSAEQQQRAGRIAALWGGLRDSPRAVLVLSLALMLAIASLDYVTGFEVSLALLYLIPIGLVTWFVGRGVGTVIALAAVVCWFLSFGASHPYSRPFYFYWEGGITLTSMLVFVALLSLLRSSMERELLARHREAVDRTARLVALGEFASAIAHELTQPLAAIGTYNDASLRLLEQGGADPRALREAMSKARDQAKRAGAIIQRLREFLRQPAPALVEEDLNAVARAAIELATPEAVKAGVSLDFRPGQHIPMVRGDRLLLEQVALNLLRNAIDAVQPLPPERRRVLLTTLRGPGHAVLAVADDGEGVAAPAAERLFDPFFTTKPGGIGLGLSICRSVVEVHGGSLRHEPNGARGARFSFTLPAGA